MIAADLGGSAHIISSGKPKKEMPYVKLQNHHAVFEELLKNDAVNSFCCECGNNSIHEYVFTKTLNELWLVSYIISSVYIWIRYIPYSSLESKKSAHLWIKRDETMIQVIRGPTWKF